MSDVTDDGKQYTALFAKFNNEEMPKSLANGNEFDDMGGSKTNLLKSYLYSKRIEGCSIGTLRDYYATLLNFAKTIDKNVCSVTAGEIRDYLLNYQQERSVSNRTLNTMRLTIRSFYKYLEEEDYIDKSPAKKLHKIKYEDTVKKPFTDEEIEELMSVCRSDRERAIISFLVSSGVRVSELVQLNIQDIDMAGRECIVFGKGAKERTVYFDVRTKIYLEKYLKRRNDTNNALFLSEKNGILCRITRSGVEYLLNSLAERANMEGVHPHRFRRTFATKLIDRGVPIEQVQKLLGHAKIETTLIYAQVNQKNVKSNHTKYI